MNHRWPEYSAIQIFFVLLGFWIALWPGWAEARSSSLHEKDFAEAWCAAAGGVTEVVQADRTRIDCVTGEYAVEVDFGAKWAEAIGQALFYSAQSGLKPGIVLILKKPSEDRFLTRLKTALDHHGLIIRIWVMRPEDLPPADANGNQW